MTDILVKALEEQDTLCHHGILGQKWGVRRYQNPDGSLTEEGRKRCGTSDKLNPDGSLNDRGKKMIKDISEGNFGPGDVLKYNKLKAAANVINSDPNNQTWSKFVINNGYSIEKCWDELSNKYGMDPEDESADGTNEDILRRLSSSDQMRAEELLNRAKQLENIDALRLYAEHLSGENASYVDKYRAERALRILQGYGLLDPDNVKKYDTGMNYVNRLLDNKTYNKKMDEFLKQEADKSKSFVDRLIAAVNRLNMASGSSGWMLNI